MEQITFEFRALKFRTKIFRCTWALAYNLCIRTLPRRIGAGWVKMIYRCFGAKVSRESYLYNSAWVYDPRNLILEGESELGPHTEIYNVNLVKLEDGARVSQRAYICTASHDITESTKNMRLISAPITICRNAWVAADTFIGMGVTIGEGAVVGARAAVFKNVEPWTIVGGNPAKILGFRKIKK